MFTYLFGMHHLSLLLTWKCTKQKKKNFLFTKTFFCQKSKFFLIPKIFEIFLYIYTLVLFYFSLFLFFNCFKFFILLVFTRTFRTELNDSLLNSVYDTLTHCLTDIFQAHRE